MSNLIEIKEQRSKLLLDAQHILLNAPDSEKRASAQKMIADADALEADIQNLERIAKFEAEERSRTAPPRPVPGSGVSDETEVRKAEKKALEQYLRFGSVDAEHRSFLKEHRDMTTATAGQVVPQGFYPVLTEAMKSYGNILNVITQKDSDTGAPTKYATVNDTGNLLSVVGENVAVSEADPTTSGAIISSDFLTTGVIKVSLAELQDSAFDLDAWIKGAFGKRYFRGLSQMVTNGSSSGNIASLKPSANTGATSAAPTVIAWSDVVNVFASLDSAYETDAAWSMNTVTRGQLLGTVDTLGRPIYVPAVTADSFDQILGKQVVINPYMDDPTAGNTPILYGDHSAYLLRNVKPGLSIMRLNERFADQGAVGFIGFARAGGALLQAGVNPIVALKMHA